MSCRCCEDEDILIEREFDLVPWFFSVGHTLTDSDLNRIADTFGVVVDRGHLRLVDIDDYNCLDHGEKIKINFCPMCGKKLTDC
ncbi:MAG: hypothetical protein GY928_24300 [Colwellia sp.]|nr:hypothetical protein [Colwellia sp.]